MSKLLLAFALTLATSAAADDLTFSTSVPGIPSVDRRTWTATCQRGISISGHCETHDQDARHLESFGSDGPHRFCKWAEPLSNATVTALCLFEE
jgi:hypothetical protein